MKRNYKIYLIIILLNIISLNKVISLDFSNLKYPKNIILMIGDGMGINHIITSSYYLNGKDSGMIFQNFPKQLYVSTYCGKAESNKHTLGFNSDLAHKDFYYLKSEFTDSAPAATAISTGTKTFEGAIGVDLDSNKLEHITTFAKKLGKSTGVASTVQISHATPAGFVAHNVSRNNYSQIAQEMIDSDIDVIIGAGHPYYDNNGKKRSNPEFKFVGGEDYWNKITSNNYKNWTFIEKKSDFEKYINIKPPKRLIGITQVEYTNNQERDGNQNAKPYEVPLNSNVPSLETISKVALNVLSPNPMGFFLMIEGGAIDWACHENQLGRMIEEVDDFEKAVAAVNNWVEKNSSWDETLLIVTADHETGYITGPKTNDNNLKTNPIINNGKNVLPSIRWNNDNHTNALVPIFLKGAGSEFFELFADEVDILKGKYINNTEIGIICRLFFKFKELEKNGKK